MAATRSRLTAVAAVLMAVSAASQRQEVAPRCSRPFAPPAPSCFCSRTRTNDWAVICGCPEDTFPAGQEVVLTSKLLPPTVQAADRLSISLLGCRRSVRMSTDLLAAADARFASITLEVTDTDELLLPELPPAPADGRRPQRYSSINAKLKRVSVPRLTGVLFSQRLAVRATFIRVNIGEIAAGAFSQTLLEPAVAIVRSRVGRIAGGAFRLPVGVESADAPLTGLQIVRSHVDEWATGGHVGGVLLHVLESNITRLRTGAVSTAGLVELHWNQTSVGEAEPAAVYQHLELFPPNILGFFGNTFQSAAASNDSRGILHFEHGVPSALQFVDNDVWGATAPPVTPAPWLEQVAGTRLDCQCRLLQRWLVDSEAFLLGAQCRPSSPGDLRLRRVASFYRSRCDADRRLLDRLDDEEEEEDRSVAPPISSGARLAAAIAQLAAGFYSTRTLVGL